MTKERYALAVIIAGVALVIAAALLIIFTGPKETPWELTTVLLPGEVQAASIWDATDGSASRLLTDEEILEVVHLINRLEKPDFKENSSHAGTTPNYGLQLICTGMELHIVQVGGTKTEMSFDPGTAKALKTDQWIVDNAALADLLSDYANTVK